MTWLNWLDAAGQPIAGTTGLPGYGAGSSGRTDGQA